jgi:small subunit ribosomal protein S9
MPGEGKIVVNGRPWEQYFPRPTSRMIILQPFELTQTLGRYDVVANVHGGGLAAQAEAVRHGITRTLLVIDPEFRPILKKAGFIRRDPREVERKKYGRHKARKRPQYSKR